MLRDGVEIQEARSPPVSNAGVDGPGDGTFEDERDLIPISPVRSDILGPAVDFAAGGAADTSIMTYSPTTRSGSDAGSSTTSLTSRQSIRRTGSNIASLRATFEQKDAKDAAETPVKRFERFPVRANSPRTPESDVETAKLRDQLRDTSARCVVLEEKARRLEEAAGERRKYQDQCLSLEKELEVLRVQLRQQKEDNVKLEREVESGTSGSVKSQEDGSMAMRQLQDLKRSISTATWIGNQVTDSTFAQETQNLHHEIQNWVVNHFRRVKLDKTPEELCARLESVSEPKQMNLLRPVFQSYTSSVKLPAIQAVVVCYLVEIFEEPLLFGLPSQGEWRRYLRKTMETLPSVLEPGPYNKWRSFTLDLIKKGGRIQESVESASRSMSEMICIVLSTLTDVDDFETRVPSLNAIVKRAISLSHLYRVQRAGYEFRLPLPGSNFNPEFMEDCSIDGDETAESFVKCATFPFVVKRGDENGDNPQLSNIIVKAKVLCNR